MYLVNESLNVSSVIVPTKWESPAARAEQGPRAGRPGLGTTAVFSLCLSASGPRLSSPWEGRVTGGRGWVMPSGWVAAASSAGGNCFLSREWELLNSVLRPAAAPQAGTVCVGSRAPGTLL